MGKRSYFFSSCVSIQACLSDLDDCVTQLKLDKDVILELILFCLWQSGEFDIAQSLLQVVCVKNVNTFWTVYYDITISDYDQWKGGK